MAVVAFLPFILLHWLPHRLARPPGRGLRVHLEDAYRRDSLHPSGTGVSAEACVPGMN